MKQRHVMLAIYPPIPLRYGGIALYAKEHNWHITIADRLVRSPSPAGWSGDGAMVTLRDEPGLVRFATGLMKRGVPVVDLTYYRPEIAVPRCIPDYESAGRAGAKHLREIGMKRVVWFSTFWSNVHDLFYKGFSEEWASLNPVGSAPPPAKIVVSERVPRTRLDDHRRLVRVFTPILREMEKPCGVLTYNDEDAARLEWLCLEAGVRVPDEIAILGIANDTLVCENQQIPISSVVGNLSRNGYEGAALLDRLMNGEPPPERPLLVPCGEIVQRRSTNCVAVDNPVLRKALEIIAEEFVNPPSAPQMAERVGVSRATLDRLFARDLDRSMRDEIMRRRLDKAKSLLRKSVMPVRDIAAACGFCNAGHFVNTFKSVCGTTPANWRETQA